MGAFISLVGQKFGKLTVISQDFNRGNLVQWVCLCECGNQTTGTTKKLRGGRKNSCGCLWLPAVVKAKTKHGHASQGQISPTLSVWMSMRSRCSNPSNPAYQNYGGRGVTVDQAWDDFSVFLKDMGEKPSGTHSIERVNNNLGYNKDNCVWADVHTQSRNKRSNVNVLYQGSNMCVTDAAALAGLGVGTVLWRIKNGWPEQAWFNKPWQ